MELAFKTNKENTIIKIAGEDDCKFVSNILQAIEKTAKKDGTRIAKYSPKHIELKIKEEKAIIALVDGVFAGFCYIEDLENKQYVATLGLIVDDKFRDHDLSRKIREKAFHLSREKFPDAKLFSLTYNDAVIKFNREIGFVTVSYLEVTNDEVFWRGCESCINHDVLMRSDRKYCICTAMLYDTNNDTGEVEKQLLSMGYTVVFVPNKSMFCDILKSFEDYAKLKGYNIMFSIENSIQNKIAFKFAVMDGIDISEQKIRKDILEYAEKIKNGNGFIDDMPILISEAEHLLIANILKNKINLLIHKYTLELAMKTQPIINIQIGENNNFVTANNSENISQIDNSSVEKYTDNSDYSVITITNSFNEKKEQIEKIDEILRLLNEEKDLELKEKQTLTVNFNKIKEELAEKEQPSKRKIVEYLANIKKVMEIVTLTHWTIEAIKWLYDKFNFVF